VFLFIDRKPDDNIGSKLSLKTKSITKQPFLSTKIEPTKFPSSNNLTPPFEYAASMAMMILMTVMPPFAVSHPELVNMRPYESEEKTGLRSPYSQQPAPVPVSQCWDSEYKSPNNSFAKVPFMTSSSGISESL
jgi:hypothetical protein